MSSEATVLRGKKADDAHRARVDTELRSNRYLQGAKSDPRFFDPELERAFDEASELVRAAAKAEGYADGYASGRTQATIEVRKELGLELAVMHEAETRRAASTAMLVAALGQAIDNLETRMVPKYEEIANQLGPAAYLLVETILGRELTLSADLALDAVRRACAAAPRDSEVTIRLNPINAKTLETIDLDSAIGRPVRILTDVSLAHGDAVAESGATRVDARLSTALARVKEMLEG